MNNKHESRQSWQEERKNILENANLVVIKVGSAVLADSHGLNMEVLQNLARQMAQLRNTGEGRKQLVLVTSAAVAAGRARLVRDVPGTHDTTGLAAKQAVAAIGQCQLMQAWDSAFQPYGIPIAQVLLTRDDLRARQRFLNARNTFSELLSWGVLPIVNENDTVSVQELKFGDNDSLASLLVNLVGGQVCVNLTSAPGVRADNPQINPDAPILDYIDDAASLDLNRMCGGKTTVGTGGMYSKLRAAQRAAQIGVPTLILPGRDQDVLSRAFSGDCRCGTWIRPASHAISRRKFWLAYQSDPSGSIQVDKGAANALQCKGSSLLPGGICGVDGTFQKGALVRVSFGEQNLGVGLSNYSASDLKKIMGLKRHEVAAILGDAHYPEVIHRDNLLLEAAL